MRLEILNERVRSGNLFHGTRLEFAIHAIATNELGGSTEQYIPINHKTNQQKQIWGTSTSRDLNVASNFFRDAWANDKFGVVFELDYNKVKSRNKIIPLDYFHNSDFNPEHDEDLERSEAEEFVVGAINNLMNCIVNVYMSPSAYALKNNPKLIETIREMLKDDEFDYLKHNKFDEAIVKLYSMAKPLPSNKIFRESTFKKLTNI